MTRSPPKVRSTVSSSDAFTDEPNVVNSATTAVPTISADALPAVRRGLRIALRRAMRPVWPRSTGSGAPSTRCDRAGDDRARAPLRRAPRAAAPRPALASAPSPLDGGERSRSRRRRRRASAPSDGTDLRHPGAVDGRHRAAPRCGATRDALQRRREAGHQRRRATPTSDADHDRVGLHDHAAHRHLEAERGEQRLQPDRQTDAGTETDG